MNHDVKVTVACKPPLTITFPYSNLDKMRFSDDETKIIKILFHEANAKTLYKNSERAHEGIMYGLEIL